MTVTRLFGIAAAAAAAAALAGQCQPQPSASAEAPEDPANAGTPARTIDVRRHGAVGDGLTDNTAAFAVVADLVNRAAPGPAGQATVVFPPGRYVYAGGLVFSSPVRLTGPGATLDYRGREMAVKLGPDGLTGESSAGHLDYAVDGLTFTGGASMVQGIYFNTFVAQPRVTGATFVNFGAGGAWAIWFQSHNRDARVTDSRFFADDAGAHQFIRANGVAADGTSDLGQTRLTVSNVLATNRSIAAGTAIYTNGFHSSITDSMIEGFSPGIQVGSNGGASSEFTHIDLVHLEVRRGSLPCILYGERDGPYRASFTDHLAVERSYCNLHDAGFAAGAAFIGPAGPDSRLRGATIEGNLVFGAPGGMVAVVLNDLVGQDGNSASRNFAAGSPIPVRLLHTRGANIASWGGGDEAANR